MGIGSACPRGCKTIKTSWAPRSCQVQVCIPRTNTDERKYHNYIDIQVMNVIQNVVYPYTGMKSLSHSSILDNLQHENRFIEIQSFRTNYF